MSVFIYVQVYIVYIVCVYKYMFVCLFTSYQLILEKLSTHLSKIMVQKIVDGWDFLILADMSEVAFEYLKKLIYILFICA
jgi:hypothetical protein